MTSVDPLNHSLYFSAVASAAQQASTEARKKEKAVSAKRSPFTSALKKSIEKEALVSAGLPVEIAGLSEEEAVVFLKDAVDTAGDELIEKMTTSAFSGYKTAVSQFMRYIVKNTFEIEKHKRPGFNRKGKPRDPAIQIQIINKRLDTLASDLLYNHLEKLKLLAKVDEINGLIVDLLAV
jgi:uncharacterized protein